MTQDEFSIIERYFGSFSQAGKTPAPEPASGVALGPGDDCAILTIPPGFELCASTDTLLADVHFPATAPAAVVARRTLGANLSDLAAMGARPHAFLLALTLPVAEASWLEAFSACLHRLSATWEIPLAGGNLCRGPLSLTMTVFGTAPAGTMIRRSGANQGDDIYVTGHIGDAGAGLQLFLQDPALSDSASKELIRRYTAPTPRIETGQALRQIATAMIDISDGLLADLEHLLTASGAGAEVEVERIPLSQALLTKSGLDAASVAALTAGDDYELCFTAPPSKRHLVQSVSNSTDVKITSIGVITGHVAGHVAGGTRTRIIRNGQPMNLENTGYDHFAR